MRNGNFFFVIFHQKSGTVLCKINLPKDVPYGRLKSYELYFYLKAAFNFSTA